ncbi:MAG: 2-C-methyl-D-erythritol 2,4-cyclodiphosphate synthase [Brevinematales bacterium]|nr:2-C-methyl-D-erythritol 2,4-cyclodiphosphate synthase [Brevinematales bacterium]
MIKAGIGYDLHRLVKGRELILGGEKIESEWGCLAHSDGDVLIHSLIDSIVSPALKLDIGKLFPDNEENYKDISSLELLKIVKQQYLKNIKILSIDSVIILDKPKIGNFIPKMIKNISSILEIDEEIISIKGKTSENTRLFSVESYTVSLIEK